MREARRVVDISRLSGHVGAGREGAISLRKLRRQGSWRRLRITPPYRITQNAIR
jgi:hypothetical protein